eukprot:s6152_g1.t1
MGCLRLRGQARAVDVGRLIHDQQWMIKRLGTTVVAMWNLGKFQTHVEVELRELKDELARLMEGQGSLKTPRSSAGSNCSNASERGWRCRGDQLLFANGRLKNEGRPTGDSRVMDQLFGAAAGLQ